MVSSAAQTKRDTFICNKSVDTKRFTNNLLTTAGKYSICDSDLNSIFYLRNDCSLIACSSVVKTNMLDYYYNTRTIYKNTKKSYLRGLQFYFVCFIILKTFTTIIRKFLFVFVRLTCIIII